MFEGLKKLWQEAKKKAEEVKEFAEDEFEGLKKLWQEAKKKAEEAQEFAKDNGVIKMPPAVFGHEHETMPVDLSPRLLLRKSTLLNTKVNLERIIAKINSLDVDERKEWEQLKVASIRLIYQVDIIINQNARRRQLEMEAPRMKEDANSRALVVGWGSVIILIVLLIYLVILFIWLLWWVL